MQEGIAHARARSIYRENGNEVTRMKHILFLGHTSRFVSHFPRMSPAISSVRWIRRGKDTSDMYVSAQRRKGFRRDRFPLQCSLSFLSHLALPLLFPPPRPPTLYPYTCFFLQVMALPRHFRLCLRVSEMPVTRRVLPQRRRVCCRCSNTTDEGKNKKKERYEMMENEIRERVEESRIGREDCREWV